MNDSGRRLLSRRRAGIRMAAFALAAFPVFRGTTRAATVTAIERIEEDWVLVIGKPDPTNHAPGVKMIMSTQGNLDGFSADYNINFHKEGTTGAFIAGGYSIDLCRPNDSSPLSAVGPGSSLLKTDGETLVWTQRLQLSDGMLSFSLRDTSSKTWGSTTGELVSVSTRCSLVDLSGYDPSFSASQSGPIWWPKRVASLTLAQVRYYDAQGQLLSTDPLPRAAYP